MKNRSRILDVLPLIVLLWGRCERAPGVPEALLRVTRGSSHRIRAGRQERHERG